MSLVLAIASHQGVVLASDGQSTANAAGQPVKRRTTKLADHAGRFAWGWVGCAGLQQTFSQQLDDIDSTADSEQLRHQLARKAVGVQQQAMKQYMPFSGEEPPELACLFGWWDGGPRILEIPRTGGDHQFCSDYAAIGSGDVFAQLALGTLPCDAHALSLEEAKLVAYAAVADAIEVAAVFVGPPIQMRVVTERGIEPVRHDEIERLLPTRLRLLRTLERAALASTAQDRNHDGPGNP